MHMSSHTFQFVIFMMQLNPTIILSIILEGTNCDCMTDDGIDSISKLESYKKIQLIHYSQFSDQPLSNLKFLHSIF